MTSKIYIVTRFNAPVFKHRPDLADRRLDDDWLRERVRLFKEYCYPSVAAQTKERFIWIIWCHPDSPEWMKKELSNIRASYEFRRAYFINRDSYYDYIDTDVDTLVTVRLDNDDMIHEDFIKAIHEHIPVFEASGLPRQVYSFTKGYRYYDIEKPRKYPGPNFHAGKLIECEMHNNPFLVLFANLREKPATDTDHLVYFTDHGKMTETFPTKYNHDLRAWAWVYHGGNTASLKVKPGDVVDNKILKEFGVEK